MTRPPPAPPIWLIDGTLVARRMFGLTGDQGRFVQNFCKKVWSLRLMADTVGAKPVVVFDRDANVSWRKEFQREYKHRRSFAGERDQQVYAANLNIVKTRFLKHTGVPFIVSEGGLEGDDVLAKLATRAAAERSVIEAEIRARAPPRRRLQRAGTRDEMSGREKQGDI
ncbi:unnamed protein product [Amoebophrya sp. A25]|nr:unnamed protein product [Amoebophrya sp. A25]|eukprot:GSA25T00015919001.1